MMSRALTSAVMLVLVAVAALCGCSKSSPLPLELAQRIATADRVVLTNYPSSSLEFCGSEAKALVAAVSESKRMKTHKDQGVACPAGYYFQFYRGTNLLIQIEGHDNHFQSSDGDFYRDGSGALQAAWKAVRDSTKR